VEDDSAMLNVGAFGEKETLEVLKIARGQWWTASCLCLFTFLIFLTFLLIYIYIYFLTFLISCLVLVKPFSCILHVYLGSAFSLIKFRLLIKKKLLDRQPSEGRCIILITML
jgi:fatty acid desaturase